MSPETHERRWSKLNRQGKGKRFAAANLGSLVCLRMLGNAASSSGCTQVLQAHRPHAVPKPPAHAKSSQARSATTTLWSR